MINIRHYLNLVEYARSVGIDHQLLLSFVDDEELDLDCDNQFISEKSYLDGIDYIINQDKGDTGLKFGLFLSLKSLAFVSDLTTNAGTVEQAVLLLDEYLKQAFPLVRLEILKNESVKVNLLPVDSELKHQDEILLFSYIFIYRELNILTGKKNKFKLFAPNFQKHQLQNALNVKVGLGRTFSFEIESELFRRPVNHTAINGIEKLLPAYLKALNKTPKDYREFSSRVRRLILELCTPEIPEFEKVVSLFPMSKRSFQRRLKAEGNSFRKISNDIKRELADYLNYDSTHSLEEIALALGYSEASALIHARNNWEKKKGVIA